MSKIARAAKEEVEVLRVAHDPRVLEEGVRAADQEGHRDLGRDARDRLTAAGLTVRYREDAVGHTISPGALAQARGVLGEVLPP